MRVLLVGGCMVKMRGGFAEQLEDTLRAQGYPEASVTSILAWDLKTMPSMLAPHLATTDVVVFQLAHKASFFRSEFLSTILKILFGRAHLNWPMDESFLEKFGHQSFRPSVGFFAKETVKRLVYLAGLARPYTEPNAFESDLKKLLAWSAEQSAPVVMLSCFPGYGWFTTKFRSRFSQSMGRLCQSAGVPFVALPELTRAERLSLLADGGHLNFRGHAWVRDGLLPVLLRRALRFTSAAERNDHASIESQHRVVER